MNGTRKTGDGAGPPSDREQRLAEALRRNLRRRKDQARRRKTQAPDGQDKAPEKP